MAARNHAPTAELRDCWTALLSAEASSLADARWMRRSLALNAHARARLSAETEVSPDVGVVLAAAYEETAEHLARQAGLMTCYVGIPQVFFPRESLTSQIKALSEMADETDIAPKTLTRVVETVARDLAWLVKHRAGGRPGPQDSVDASATDCGAARLLVNTLWLRDRVAGEEVERE